ncbi:Importin subunit alpha [Diplonema papillatum]|nr:Importin subunit alpha [Diplonema papillatum]
MSVFAQQQQKDARAGVNFDREASKRRDLAATLRQKKKEELLREKRRRDVPGDDEKLLIEDDSSQMQQARIPELAAGLYNGTPQQQLEATVILRKLLSASTDPPIDEVIANNCVPKLIQFLSRNDEATLQFEAAWALTNVASGRSEHTDAVVKAGAVPEFVRLLSSPSEDVRDQSIWAVGNIAGDSAAFRDLVLDAGVLEPILRIIHNSPRITTLRNATWCLSNFFRSKPEPKCDHVKSALPTIAMLLNHGDDEVVTDACWAISNASDGQNHKIAQVLELNVNRRLVELLASQQYSVVCPALRAIGNIATGSTEQTQSVIDADALPAVLELMKYPKRNIRKECCWTLSNLTAGTQEQIQQVIQSGALPLVVKAMATQEFEVKKEAVWTIANLVGEGNMEQVYHAVNAGCIEPMVELLSSGDPKLIATILKGFHCILSSGEQIVTDHGGSNEYKTALASSGGLDKIQALQAHSSEEVFEGASDIVMQFFASEIEDAPAASEAARITF